MLARLFFAAIALTLLATSPSQAMEDKMFPSKTHPWRKYTGDLPPCGFPKVFDRIAWHFYERETQYWESRMTIAGFEHPKEIAMEPWGLEYVPRRFCRADVWTSDGVKRDIYYSIAEGLGEAGIGWGVDWCIVGLDRNLAYAPRCQMARP